MIKKISMLLLTALIAITIANSKTVYAAASDIDGPDTIHKEVDQIFTIIDLLKLYDRDVFIESDGYTGYGNVPGDYIVVLNRGETTKTVTITVIEEWGDLLNSNDVLFVADKSDIYLSNDRKLTHYEIVHYIYGVTGYVDTSNRFLFEEILNEYYYNFEEKNIPEGSYAFTFKITYFSGEQSTYSTYIHAVEVPELSGTILEPPPSTFEKIKAGAPVYIVVGIIIYFLINKKYKKRGFK